MKKKLLGIELKSLHIFHVSFYTMPTNSITILTFGWEKLRRYPGWMKIISLGSDVRRGFLLRVDCGEMVCHIISLVLEYSQAIDHPLNGIKILEETVCTPYIPPLKVYFNSIFQYQNARGYRDLTLSSSSGNFQSLTHKISTFWSEEAETERFR